MRRVAMLSVHTSPLAQPGTGNAGGMNVSIRALGTALARAGVAVDGGSATGAAPTRVRALAADRSAPLGALLEHQNHESDNLYAELTARGIDKPLLWSDLLERMRSMNLPTVAAVHASYAGSFWTGTYPFTSGPADIEYDYVTVGPSPDSLKPLHRELAAIFVFGKILGDPEFLGDLVDRL